MNIEFPAKKFEFKITPIEPIILPLYKGSTLRGGFGNAFRRVVCALKKNDCGECILKEKCVYSYIFETPPPSDTKIMRKYTSAPHPFILEPPPEKKRGYTPKDEITFGLTLIGKAVDYLPYFVYTFDELGRMGIGKGRGKYELKTVRTNPTLKRGAGGIFRKKTMGSFIHLIQRPLSHLSRQVCHSHESGNPVQMLILKASHRLAPAR